MRKLLLLLALGACAPINGDVTISIAPTCGGNNGGQTNCSTSIMVEAKSDPSVTLAPVTSVIP